MQVPPRSSWPRHVAPHLARPLVVRGVSLGPAARSHFNVCVVSGSLGWSRSLLPLAAGSRPCLGFSPSLRSCLCVRVGVGPCCAGRVSVILMVAARALPDRSVALPWRIRVGLAPFSALRPPWTSVLVPSRCHAWRVFSPPSCLRWSALRAWGRLCCGLGCRWDVRAAVALGSLALTQADGLVFPNVA